jgi:hypothetical protein
MSELHLCSHKKRCIDGDNLSPVYRWNHDKSYRVGIEPKIELPNDGIEHLYFDGFQHLQENLDKIIEEHGRKFKIRKFL